MTADDLDLVFARRRDAVIAAGAVVHTALVARPDRYESSLSERVERVLEVARFILGEKK